MVNNLFILLLGLNFSLINILYLNDKFLYEMFVLKMNYNIVFS